MQQQTMFPETRTPSITELSDDQLVSLWKNVGRNADPQVLALLERGEREPEGFSEERYLEVHREMRHRNLPL
jgi:hypothetical protein